MSSHPATLSQSKRLDERKNTNPFIVDVCGVEFIVDRGVYDTSVDTELMIETVHLDLEDRFFELGCGSGAVSLLLASKCRGGCATDINPLAIVNSKKNAGRLKVENILFIEADSFGDITEKFNVLICNPPYNNHQVQSSIERMFWDPDDEVKRIFFQKASKYLLPGGRLYFGWANFQDIDINLPFKLAKQNNFVLMNSTSRSSHSGKYEFYVFEFVLAGDRSTF